jgi:hypothetical protein
MVAEKRLGTFGSPQVRGGSGPVQRCFLLMRVHVADPCRCCLSVQAGDTLVRLGRMAERLHAGGQHLGGGGMCRSRVALGRCQPLAGRGSSVPRGVPVSFAELLYPRADSGKPGVDLPPTACQGPRLTVGATQHVPPAPRGARRLGILLSS